MAEESSIKCVVIGDGAVGKTSLLMSYTTNEFPTNYVPTVFENFEVDLQIEGEKYTLNLFDTAGQEAYDRLRPLAYTSADIFLVCFSVACVTSFENVDTKWVPELREYCPEVPYLLVGTQVDLRDDGEYGKDELVSADMGHKMSKQVQAVGYVECSALTQRGLKYVFDEAISTLMAPPKPKKSIRCVIL